MVIPLSFPFLLLFTGALSLVLFISSQSFYLADGRSQILTSSLEFELEEKFTSTLRLLLLKNWRILSGIFSILLSLRKIHFPE